MDEGLRRRARSIWISDLHLGLRYSKTEQLLSFLDRHAPRNLYLVGDIFDGWALKRTWFWSDRTNEVVQKVLRMAGSGTRVTYIPGNHDAFVRGYIGQNFGNIQIVARHVHVTADGRRFLVTHGDEFDGILRSAPWLYRFGAIAYNLSLGINHWFGLLLRWRGRSYWSLSAFLKSRTKRAVQFINRFEELVVAEARRHGVDGIVCGHIHKAAIERIDGVLYVNTGDWVESCTAIVEDFDGAIRIESLRDVPAPLMHLPFVSVSGDGAAGRAPSIENMKVGESEPQIALVGAAGRAPQVGAGVWEQARPPEPSFSIN
jgi:UDP-2,3-diacylglucosamine pyrophosphatase LpxH